MTNFAASISFHLYIKCILKRFLEENSLVIRNKCLFRRSNTKRDFCIVLKKASRHAPRTYPRFLNDYLKIFTDLSRPDVKVGVTCERIFFHSSSFKTVIILSNGFTLKDSITF